jgi:hypothetical protein
VPRGKPAHFGRIPREISATLDGACSRYAFLAAATLLLLFANARLFANGGAWQTGVPVTGNAAASDQKKSMNVTIEDERLTIDLHQEFAFPL